MVMVIPDKVNNYYLREIKIVIILFSVDQIPSSSKICLGENLNKKRKITTLLL